MSIRRMYLAFLSRPETLTLNEGNIRLKSEGERTNEGVRIFNIEGLTHDIHNGDLSVHSSNKTFQIKLVCLSVKDVIILKCRNHRF